MTATIREVAAAAGVSVSTVSRVLRHPELFRPDTRERVDRAAAALNWAPNRAASTLITGKTGSVAVVVPNLANPIFPSLIKAAQQHAASLGLTTILADSDESPGRELRLLRELMRQVDGVMTFSSLVATRAIPAAEPRCPVVFVNRLVKGRPSIVVDATPAVRALLRAFSDGGHTAVAYLDGPGASRAGEKRRELIAAEAAEAGLMFAVQPRVAPTFEGGQLAAERLLSSGSMPTAIVAFNDVMALGAIRRLRAAGVSVPHDVSVCGYGDIPMAEMAEPPLTTIRIPPDALGRAAVDTLVGLLSGDPVQGTAPVVVPLMLVSRASTDASETAAGR